MVIGQILLYKEIYFTVIQYKLVNKLIWNTDINMFYFTLLNLLSKAFLLINQCTLIEIFSPSFCQQNGP